MPILFLLLIMLLSSFSLLVELSICLFMHGFDECKNVCFLLITDPGPPSSIVARQFSHKRIQVTWTPPDGFPNATYRVYINNMDVSTSGGIKVIGTTYPSFSQYCQLWIDIHFRSSTFHC